MVSLSHNAGSQLKRVPEVLCVLMGDVSLSHRAGSQLKLYQLGHDAKFAEKVSLSHRAGSQQLKEATHGIGAEDKSYEPSGVLCFAGCS